MCIYVGNKMHSHSILCAFIFLIACSDIWSTNVNEGANDPARLTSKMTEALKKCDIQWAMKEMAEVLSHLTERGTAMHYLSVFGAILTVAKLKLKPTIEKDRTNLEVSLEKALLIFEFLVNGTAEEALARIQRCKNSTFFSRDNRDVFLVGINFQHDIDTTQVVYTWIVNLYSANGTLKKSFPVESGKIMYSRDETYSSGNVTVRREPVRDHYDILEEVGQGFHGRVYKCVGKRSGNIFAARFRRVQVNFQRRMIYNEIKIMSELSNPTNHPNLLSLHEVFDNDAEIILIVDFVEGKLSDLVQTLEVSDYVRQICEGLQHMHSRNIAHNDVKISNVGYVMKDNARVIKLLDFSVAQKIGQIRDANRLNINELHYRDYHTPEELENRTLGTYTDMWHFGVLTFYLLTKDYPNWGRHCSEIEENIKACRWSFRVWQKEFLPDEALDFISKIFVKDVEKRMTADECLSHPWITHVI